MFMRLLAIKKHITVDNGKHQTKDYKIALAGV